TRGRPPGAPPGVAPRDPVLDQRLGPRERVVLMGSAGVNGRRPRVRWQTIAQVLLWSAIGLGAFVLLAESMQNSAAFDRLRLWILAVDACGVIALSVLLARKLYRLVRDYRRHVPGSRLTARTVGIFGSLVIAPLLIVYLSSLEFINRGIDSWFRVEVKEALNDALGLPRAALGRSLPHPRRRGARRSGRGTRRALRGGDLPGAAAARGAHGRGTERLPPVRGSRCVARAAQEQLQPHAHARAAARDARGHLRRDLLRAAPGAPRPGPHRGHPRGRQGRFRHPPAAALAR